MRCIWELHFEVLSIRSPAPKPLLLANRRRTHYKRTSMSKPDYILTVNVSQEVHDRLARPLSDKQAEECEVNRLCLQLILNSRWASWLPFGWMHSLTARYYAMKARRIFNARNNLILTPIPFNNNIVLTFDQKARL